jgi:hypothetical protein
MTGERPQRIYEGTIVGRDSRAVRIHFDRGHRFRYEGAEYEVKEIVLSDEKVRPYLNGDTRVRLPHEVAAPGILREVKRQYNERDIGNLMDQWTREEEREDDEAGMP